MPTHIDTIICDDIRKETGNKISLMGVYGKEIHIDSLPFMFPRLCILQKWRNLGGKKEAHVKLMDDRGGEPIFETKDPIILGDFHEDTVAFISIRINNLEIITAGKYLVETTFDPEEEPAYIYEFIIKKVLPQPVESDISSAVPLTAEKATIECEAHTEEEISGPLLEASDNPEMENAVSILKGKGEYRIPVKNQKVYFRAIQSGITFKFQVKGYEEKL